MLNTFRACMRIVEGTAAVVTVFRYFNLQISRIQRENSHYVVLFDCSSYVLHCTYVQTSCYTNRNCTIEQLFVFYTTLTADRN